MNTKKNCQFSLLRSFLWPIHAFELKKIVPMIVLFFLISFNYVVLRDVKDALIFNELGTELIPHLKFWGVTVCLILFPLIYIMLSNLFNRKTLFYLSIVSFLIYFIAYIFYLYPNREALKLDSFADILQNELPQALSGIIVLVRHWTTAFFYILSELWGIIVLPILFWGFANDITSTSAAKRYYALFCFGGAPAAFFAGLFLSYCGKVVPASCPAGVDSFEMSLTYLITGVVLVGICIIGLYAWMNERMLSDPRLFDQKERNESEKKPQLSLIKSVTSLVRSKYILSLAALVLCFCLCMKFFNIIWKNQLMMQFPDRMDFLVFIGSLSMCAGVLSFFMIILVSSNLMRRSWNFATLLTPFILLIIGFGFFSVVLCKDYEWLVMFSHNSLLYATIIFGAILHICSASVSSSLFKPTKEIAYIPLDRDLKVKGKAVIDVLVVFLGDTVASLLVQGLLVINGSIAAITPYVAGSFFLFLGIWIMAARSLNKQFTALSAEKAESIVS